MPAVLGRLETLLAVVTVESRPEEPRLSLPGEKTHPKIRNGTCAERKDTQTSCCPSLALLVTPWIIQGGGLGSVARSRSLKNLLISSKTSRELNRTGRKVPARPQKAQGRTTKAEVLWAQNSTGFGDLLRLTSLAKPPPSRSSFTERRWQSRGQA